MKVERRFWRNSDTAAGDIVRRSARSAPAQKEPRSEERMMRTRRLCSVVPCERVSCADKRWGNVF